MRSLLFQMSDDLLELMGNEDDLLSPPVLEQLNKIADSSSKTVALIQDLHRNSTDHFAEEHKSSLVLSEILAQTRFMNQALDKLVHNSDKMCNLLSKQFPSPLPIVKPVPLIPIKRAFSQISKPSSVGVSSHEDPFTRPCPMCRTRKHKASQCPITSRSARKVLLNLNNLCHNCLRAPTCRNHDETCPNYKCSICRGAHHSILCDQDDHLIE